MINWKIEHYDVPGQGVDGRFGVVTRIEYSAIHSVTNKTLKGFTDIVKPKDTFIPIESVTNDILFQWLFKAFGPEFKSYLEESISTDDS